MTCSQCGAKFRGIVQFAQYRCDKCGTEYYFCPDCSHEQNLCKCGGMIITVGSHPHPVRNRRTCHGLWSKTGVRRCGIDAGWNRLCAAAP